MPEAFKRLCEQANTPVSYRTVAIVLAIATTLGMAGHKYLYGTWYGTWPW